MLSSVRVVTSDMNGGMNVCVNDMRANERTCELMYVRVSVRASESVSVRPYVCTVTRHARARTYENKVELSHESTFFLHDPASTTLTCAPRKSLT